MPLSIGKNIASLHAQRRMGDATDLLTTTRERLSSGSRINRAADDAAGLAIATSLRTETRISTQAIRNVNDGISLLNIAQGALTQIEQLTSRRRELAEQASNGVYSSVQRTQLDRENAALNDEMYRILRSTQFNGLTLFDGSLATGVRIQAGNGIDGSVAFSLGASVNSTAAGTFSAAVSHFGVSRSVDLKTGDFNGDGKLDFLGTYLGDESTPAVGSWIAVTLGNGDGTFKLPSLYSSYEAPVFAEVGDFNGDGIADVAVSNRSTSTSYLDGTAVSILLGNGNGSFRAPRSYVVGAGPEQLIAKDFTGDGIVDLVVSEAGFLNGTTFSILAGNGDGTFKARVSYSTGGVSPFGLSAGDIDNNGTIDLVIPNYGNGTNSTTIGVLLNNGNGTFKAPVTYQSGTAPDSTLLFDLNGDGKLDIVATDRGNGSGNTFSVLLGNGDGSFFARRSYTTAGSGPTDVLGVDVNNDGKLDLAIMNSTSGDMSISLGNGDGSFKVATTYATTAAGTPFGLIAGDFNGDYATDIIGSNYYTTNVDIFLGTPQLPGARIGTAADARAALGALDLISERIGKELANIGAAQSRLTVAARNLTTSREQSTAAESRIRDVDIAQESAAAVALQIRQQIGASVLAQANQAPNVILSLIKG